MELHPREASLCKLVNTALRDYHDLASQGVPNAIDKLRPFAPFIWLLNAALQKLPSLTSKVVYKGVNANFSASDEYKYNTIKFHMFIVFGLYHFIFVAIL